MAQFPGILSSCGGALSLYTGFCGITVFEIIELLILFTLAWFFGYNVKDQDNNNGSNAGPQQTQRNINSTVTPASYNMPHGNKAELMASDLRQRNAKNMSAWTWQDPPGVYDVPSAGGTRN